MNQGAQTEPSAAYPPEVMFDDEFEAAEGATLGVTLVLVAGEEVGVMEGVVVGDS